MSATRRVLLWRGTDAWRAEYADVTIAADRLLARGTQIGVEPRPYRLSYALDTGTGFVTSRLTVDTAGEGWSRRLDLTRDAAGAWHMSADGAGAKDLGPPGGDQSALGGANDCDLAFSPLTNTMPIRRDGGGPANYVMAWVSVPDLAVVRSEQRYEPVGDGRVRYVDGDFRAELELDADGFCLRYPGLAERV
ncbi:MAG: putative glycolipid-binding domain-containing protein [Thermoleophilaceae bacterium]|nr:putative glycolipid-binding domain-containing protein [Thermoleophilaceae bacterium]